MKIETKVTGLSKTKREKLDGLVDFDPTTDLATFEWGADVEPPPPHDYATALNRVRDAVEGAGGEVGEGRIIG